MKRCLQLLLAGVLAFSAAPSFLRAEDAEKADKSSDAREDADAEYPGILGSKSDFDAICADAGVTGEQLDKVHALAEKRMDRLKAWINGEDGKKYLALRKQMTEVRHDRSAQMKKTQSATQPVDYDAKLKELNAEYKPLAVQLSDLRTSTRGEVLKELTAEQQERAVNANLTRRINRALEAAKLTEAQQQTVKGLIDDAAKDYLKKTPLDQDPLMRKLLGVQNVTVKKIRDEVLTEEQREAIKKEKKSEPATQKE